MEKGVFSSNSSLCFLITFACTPTPTVLFCVVFFLSFAVLPPAHIYRDALQLSGEGGVQGLRRDLQPVGDVGRGPEHLLEGPGLFPESGKEDKKGK